MSSPAIKDGFYDNVLLMRRERWNGGKLIKMWTLESIKETTHPIPIPWGAFPDVPKLK